MKFCLAPSMIYTSENVLLHVQDKRLEKWKVTKYHKDMFITMDYKNARTGLSHSLSWEKS